MKIVEVIHSLNPGGAERLLVDLSNELSKNESLEVYVLVLKNREERNENFYFEELSDRVHFISMGFGDGMNLKYPIAIYNTLKKIRPDVVHVHCVLHYMSFAMFFYRKCKFVVTLHNQAQFGFSGYRKQLITYFVKKDIAKVVTISHSNQQSFQEYTGLNNDVLIYNGRSQPEKTQLYAETEAFFSNIRTSKNTIVLLCIAKCSVQKNLKLLIDSVNYLNQNLGVDLKLIVIGDGYHKTELGKGLLLYSSSSIHFVGPKKNVADYYFLSDAFCLSSIYEGMPISLIEALACGCITISTPVSGIVDILEDGITGFISKDFSDDSYRTTLKRFIENRENIDKDLIRKIFTDNYSIDICSRSHLKLFGEI